jgi:DNA-binding response OmpR family regulator
MDIHLPGMSGLEALRILHRDPVTKHIPVIAVSANAIPLDVVSGFSECFFSYLIKPFKIDAFLEALDLALAMTSTNLLPPRVRPRLPGGATGFALRVARRGRGLVVEAHA